MHANSSQVPVTAKHDEDTQTRDWSWVEASVWTDRMLAALDNGVKGGKWFSLMDKVMRPATLQAAWGRVVRNCGAAGVDRQSVDAFAAHAERYLDELARALRSDTYRPQAIRRVEIPKGRGQTRPLGIPTVKDRVVQTAVRLVIEPIFESLFCAHSYGFRPGRGAKSALREVDALLRAGYCHVVDADLAGYFDSIPHAGLMARVREQIADGRVLRLLESWLKQEVMAGLERWIPTGGTPQGAVISPLLSNIYLHGLDETMAAGGYRMVRYADDFVVLCQTADEAQRALAEIGTWVDAHELTLHPDKSHVGDCRQVGHGFEFLGYRFEAGQRRVRTKSWNAMLDKIRQHTPRTKGRSLASIISQINPMLRGWYQYFKHAHRITFSKLDGFIRRRLRSILRAYEGRRGHGHTREDHQRWPNSYFAQQGLFTLTQAHALACRSR